MNNGSTVRWRDRGLGTDGSGLESSDTFFSVKLHWHHPRVSSSLWRHYGTTKFSCVPEHATPSACTHTVSVHTPHSHTYCDIHMRHHIIIPFICTSGAAHKIRHARQGGEVNVGRKRAPSRVTDGESPLTNALRSYIRGLRMCTTWIHNGHVRNNTNAHRTNTTYIQHVLWAYLPRTHPVFALQASAYTPTRTTGKDY